MTEVLGTTVLWIMLALGAVALVAMPALRVVAMLAIGARLASRALTGGAERRGLGTGDARPLELAGLTPGLTELARQTRHVAVELARVGEQAATWPNGQVDRQPGFWSAFVGAGGYGPQIAVGREVWEWLRCVEELAPAEREHLTSLGVDPARIRALLVAEGSPVDQVRALAGALWSIDARLGGGGPSGYRGSSAGGRGRAGNFVPTRSGSGEDEDAEALRERRRRWAEVLGRHGTALSRMAADHTRGRCEKEDLEQDIALALWQALPSFRGESSLKTFVLRVARYCCYRHLRRRRRAEVEAFVDEIGDPSACIESWLRRADAQARLAEALARLPEGLESTLALRLEGKSYAEIAATLGISEQNVSVRLTRARQRLERHLAAA